jgi:glycosyltransferase involved in cell wall biosynthesis
MRFIQYYPRLAELGIECVASPFFSDDYLLALFERRGARFRPTLAGYFRRLQRLVLARRFDLFWIEKELLPWCPAWLESLFLSGTTPFVVDYDDAWFHRYDSHSSPIVRTFLGEKLKRLIRSAELVVVGNEYLADYARLAGADRVETLPTVIDLARYPLSDRARRQDGPLVIGWIGSPSTIRFIQPIAAALRRLAQSVDFELRLVGVRDFELSGVRTRCVPWSEADEVRHIASFDIGIMPLTDTPWERGKCGYKLIQYMASAKPVVASPVGVNRAIVSHGEQGFLADTPDGWVSALGRLAADPLLRERLGLAGRDRVASTYTLDVTAPRLASWLRESATPNEHRARPGSWTLERV